MHDQMIPLTKEQLNDLQSIFSTLSDSQLIWISGYLWGVTNTISSVTDTDAVIDVNNKTLHVTANNNDVIQKQSITLISASQTGNARQLAEKLYTDCTNANLSIRLYSAKDYKFKQIAYETILILIISTYGEGEPPEEAIALYKYLFSSKAPKMNNVYYAVFGLGDKSYEYFSKAGKDFDNQLEKLGANRLCNRVDADLDFQKESIIWRKKIVSLCKERMTVHSRVAQSDMVNSVKQKNRIVYSQIFPLIACLSVRQKITSRYSVKDVHHLEIDITNSNLFYQPGDSLGVWYENDPDLVNELLDLLHLNGNEMVEVKGESISLGKALQKYYELTQNTSVIVQNIYSIAPNKILCNILRDSEQLHKFVTTTPIVDMIRQISIKLTTLELLQVLSPMKPRFYSISSAQSEVGEEIHITVSVIRYMVNGRNRTGGASGYLVDRLKEDDELRIFIKSNDNFRLPENPNVPIIMIGAGTGIAPFRAFIQHRAVTRASGKNWLFFGNLKFVDDFLYQVEWQRYVRDGILNNINTAWSRDQDYKIYVQDEVLKHAREFWSWIQEGAHVYVCGNAKNMARSVDICLMKLVSDCGKMTIEEADEFWSTMRLQNRYQRDIY